MNRPSGFPGSKIVFTMSLVIESPTRNQQPYVRRISEFVTTHLDD